MHPIRHWRVVGVVALAAVLASLSLPAAHGGPATGGEKYGDLEFPRDEHVHPTGWDYWWGAADLVTTAGNRYTVGLAFDAVYGYAADGHQVYPHQGPYAGQTIATENGPTNWGSPEEPPGRFVSRVSSYVPGVSELLRYQTIDTSEGGKTVALWERTSLADHTYHLLLDDNAARVHPTGGSARLNVDLNARMRRPPLLAGGGGRWWYDVPQAFGYPSRSFQYMQAADALSGTLSLGQPDGSVTTETVDPTRSTLEMTHEYDATPEDLPVGLGLTFASQANERYVQYNQGGLSWELLFADLENGAQLMVAALAYHDTDRATLHPVTANMPRYKVMATLRLPGGQSVPLDDVLHLEHLDYRTLIGQVPTFDVSVSGIWTEAWGYRASYGGGTVAGPDGPVQVPAFDLGFVPQFAKDEPHVDARGNGQVQRVPFTVSGSYNGCPVNGFSWSELIVNWYGHEADDPWYTGSAPPRTPKHCTSAPAGPSRRQRPAPSGTQPGEPSGPPAVQPEGGCTASDPGTPSCSYTATTYAGIGGYGQDPGGWTVTVTRPGLTSPLVIKSLGGPETYQCGTVRPGDHVDAEAKSGSYVSVGNPGICV